MKPRLFIGSSVEGLDIANAIQENLDYDCNPTVWTQGVFNLSSNALSDLLTTLDNSDFGVFVFTPDDVTNVRSSSLNTVRDNVIFELGLFIGRLGKDKVFFVIPRETQNFHLPTDLIGIAPGTFNNTRDDNNFKAALGPFCNQIRKKLKDFQYESLVDLASENVLVKKLAVEKPDYWEYLLSAELLKSRLIDINRGYLELDKDLIFQKTKVISFDEFLTWIQESLMNMGKLVKMLTKIFNEELVKAYGEPGIAGNIFEIKSAIDRVNSICKEFLAWEVELHSASVPDDFKEIVHLMRGWTKDPIEQVNKFIVLIEKSFSEENLAKNEDINIIVTFSKPKNADRINEIYDELREKYISN